MPIINLSNRKPLIDKIQRLHTIVLELRNFSHLEELRAHSYVLGLNDLTDQMDKTLTHLRKTIAETIEQDPQ